MHIANRQAVFYEVLLTNALHYIAESEGNIYTFLDNYNMIEDWEDYNCYEFFGFNDIGEPLDNY